MKTRKFGRSARRVATEGGFDEKASMLLEVGDGTHGAGGRRRRGFRVLRSLAGAEAGGKQGNGGKALYSVE